MPLTSTYQQKLQYFLLLRSQQLPGHGHVAECMFSWQLRNVRMLFYLLCLCFSSVVAPVSLAASYLLAQYKAS